MRKILGFRWLVKAAVLISVAAGYAGRCKADITEGFPDRFSLSLRRTYQVCAIPQRPWQGDRFHVATDGVLPLANH